MARYLGGIKWNIQEELIPWTPTNFYKCYQLALKIEEKNRKKGDPNFRGRGGGRDQREHRGRY